MTAAADRQDGDYSPPVLAPAQGGPVPAWNPPATMDNGDNEDSRRLPAGGATAGEPLVTEESG